jgi:hypothetical protein
VSDNATQGEKGKNRIPMIGWTEPKVLTVAFLMEVRDLGLIEEPVSFH